MSIELYGFNKQVNKLFYAGKNAFHVYQSGFSKLIFSPIGILVR